jgi:hypothetical protein
MPLPLEERKQKHFEFMCAALTGVSAGLWGKKVEVDIAQTIAKLALCFANAALSEYEKRWEGET